MRHHPAKGEQPVASVSSSWSAEHGTWILSRYDYATAQREVIAVHPRPLRSYESGTLQLWLAKSVEDLKVGPWLTLTDVYGYYETAPVYA